jgi:serine/threonine-protein kinase
MGSLRYEFKRALEVRLTGEETWLAQRQQEGCAPAPVVIKRLPEPFSFGQRQRLSEEAVLAMRLRHPAIAQVHHVIIRAERALVLMEHVDGPQLDTLLGAAVLRRRPLSLAFALYLAAELAEALHHAHTLVDEQGRPLGIIHRDVSPRNVRVDLRTGAVKLTSFGAAYSLVVGREETPAQLLRGDVAYASPEYLQRAPMTARSDLFSLGVLLLEVLSNRHLFAEAADEKPRPPPPGLRRLETEQPPTLPLDVMCSRMARFTPDDVRTTARGLPMEVQALLHALLQREPRSRMASAAELREALLRLQHAGPRPYGRSEAALEAAEALAEGGACRDSVELLEEGFAPAGLEAHEIGLPDTGSRT